MILILMTIVVLLLLIMILPNMCNYGDAIIDGADVLVIGWLVVVICDDWIND